MCTGKKRTIPLAMGKKNIYTYTYICMYVYINTQNECESERKKNREDAKREKKALNVTAEQKHQLLLKKVNVTKWNFKKSVVKIY